MIFTYKPEGADERVWQVKAGRLLSPEMEAIERVTGTFYLEWCQALLDGSVTAVRALLWVLLKRENPQLKYDEVRFTYDEFDLDYDLDEKAQIVGNYDAAIEDGAPEPGPGYVAMIEAYRAELPAPKVEETVDLDTVEDPESYEVDAPKASPAPSSESATSGSSPATFTSHRLTSTG